MQTTRRRLIAAAAATPFAAGVARRAAAAATSSITYGQSTATLTLDPAHGCFTGYPGGYETALCLYDGLLSFDAKMRIIPQLAAQFTMAGDLRSARVTLRPGVIFQDGTAVDAAAVKTNLTRMMNKTLNPTNRPLWDPLAAVETPDAATVVITLRQPFSQLPNTLAHASGVLVSPAAMQRFGETGIARHPVGAGPYRLQHFTPGEVAVLEAFDRYWGGRPKTDRLVFRAMAEAAARLNALKTGAADVIDAVPAVQVASLRRSRALDVLTSPSLRPIGFAINLTHPHLAELNVRQALNLAVPVKEIAGRAFYGLARVPDSPLAFNTDGYAPVSPLVYDPKQARDLLAAAGRGPKTPLALSMYASDGLFPGDTEVAQIVAAALGEAGVKVSITKVEAAAYWDALRQDEAHLRWDIAMFGFNPSNASGLYALNSLFRANANDAGRPDAWNIGRYRSPAVDKLLDVAGTDADAAARQSALAKAQAIIWHDAPYIWLQITENISAVRSGVTGVELWPIVFTVLRRAA